MNRLLTFLLVLVLLVGMAGCQQEASVPAGAAFYYCPAQPDYTKDSAALTPEYRTGVSETSLANALELYLAGPISPELSSPFPQGLKLVGVSQEGDTVYLTLSRELALLTDLELTLACGCLTLTTLAITQAKTVEIRPVAGLLNGQRAIVMDKNTLLLLDTAPEGE